jgi:hypothetical protein
MPTRIDPYNNLILNGFSKKERARGRKIMTFFDPFGDAMPRL